MSLPVRREWRGKRWRCYLASLVLSLLFFASWGRRCTWPKAIPSPCLACQGVGPRETREGASPWQAGKGTHGTSVSHASSWAVLCFFVFFLFFEVINDFYMIKKISCVLWSGSMINFFIELFKLEFHGMEKWWNLSSKNLKFLLTWQVRVPKNWDSDRKCPYLYQVPPKSLELEPPII